MNFKLVHTVMCGMPYMAKHLREKTFTVVRIIHCLLDSFHRFYHSMIQVQRVNVSVWLPWRMPRLHVEWGSSHRWVGIFFCVQVDSEDNSLL